MPVTRESQGSCTACENCRDECGTILCCPLCSNEGTPLKVHVTIHGMEDECADLNGSLMALRQQSLEVLGLPPSEEYCNECYGSDPPGGGGGEYEGCTWCYNHLRPFPADLNFTIFRFYPQPGGPGDGWKFLVIDRGAQGGSAVYRNVCQLDWLSLRTLKMQLFQNDTGWEDLDEEITISFAESEDFGAECAECCGEIGVFSAASDLTIAHMTFINRSNMACINGVSIPIKRGTDPEAELCEDSGTAQNPLFWFDPVIRPLPISIGGGLFFLLPFSGEHTGPIQNPGIFGECYKLTPSFLHIGSEDSGTETKINDPPLDPGLPDVTDCGPPMFLKWIDVPCTLHPVFPPGTNQPCPHPELSGSVDIEILWIDH